MERSAIVPHITWRGPQPAKETDAYLLAMLLRIFASGLDSDDQRDELMHPSVLTTNNLELIAVMYAYYKNKMEEEGVRNTEDMLKLIRASDENCVADWAPNNKGLISEAASELIEYVDTPGHPGFSAFG